MCADNSTRVPTIQNNGRRTPVLGEESILVTSALPYVNNVPHLGNIVGSVLSADVFSRYNKARNRNTIYVCGTDEYGTATETRAVEEGITPQALCDKYHRVHKEIYDWFGIDFDYFGRTTTPKQTEIAQHIFKRLHENGLLEEHTGMQPFCERHGSFLADRFVEGVCPNCGYEEARGDQCDQCGRLLNPLELKQPRCKLDGSTPVARETTHIYLCLDKIQPELEDWLSKSYTNGKWSKNAYQITKSWLKEGLRSRAITRDLKWGTPVPLPGYEEKVLYVWFDACIGYLSITASHLPDWEKWWRNPEVKLYQFMGKDNVPFHSIIFPSSLLGTGEKWTKLHHLSATEYLNYEKGKFSKSRGIGVFGDNAQQTGIPASVWRYYLLACRPETSDSQFEWDSFIRKNNSELVGNLGNLVNRVIKFTNKNLASRVPDYRPKLSDHAITTLQSDVNQLLSRYINELEEVHLRSGLETAMAISTRGNQFLTENKFGAALLKENSEHAHGVIGAILNLIYLLSAVLYPYIPATSHSIARQLNMPLRGITPTWSIGDLLPGHKIMAAEHLFSKIDENMGGIWKVKYGSESSAPYANMETEAHKRPSGRKERNHSKHRDIHSARRQISPGLIDFRGGHVVRAIEHPNADALYVLFVDCGDEPGAESTSLDSRAGRTVRTVCSGLKGRIPISELQGLRVVIVSNLKPVKMRGIESSAMLLTAIRRDDLDGAIEIVSPPDAVEVGERLTIEGFADISPETILDPKEQLWETVKSGLKTTSTGEIIFDRTVLSPTDGSQMDRFRRLISSEGRACRVRTLFEAVVC